MVGYTHFNQIYHLKVDSAVALNTSLRCQLSPLPVSRTLSSPFTMIMYPLKSLLTPPPPAEAKRGQLNCMRSHPWEEVELDSHPSQMRSNTCSRPPLAPPGGQTLSHSASPVRPLTRTLHHWDNHLHFPNEKSEVGKVTCLGPHSESAKVPALMSTANIALKWQLR